MRRIFAPALMVSALALSPAVVMADDSSGQNAEPSSESMTDQNTGQTDATQNDESMTEDNATSTDSSTSMSAETSADRGGFVTAQNSNQTLSETYIGASVLAGSGEERESIGTISQLIFDDSHAITGAVVDVGGFLGLGAKPVGLQWESLEERRAEDTVAFTTSMTREDFENAPEFKDLDEQRSEQELQSEEPASTGTTGTTGVTD
ncbi:MAG: PRC-barrel domain-containing protein [Rhodovibrionaceae bacterium]